MSSANEVTNHLLELGLNNYEAKVYLTLVEEGVSTAKNVSDITGIPYGKVYEIITSLCAKGFSMTLPTKPMKCKALSPCDILKKVKEKEMEKFDSLEELFNRELVPVYAQSKRFDEPRGIMWLVNGRANICKKIEALIIGAKRSALFFTTENGLKRLAFQKNLLKDAHDRGVDIRIITKKTKGNAEDCELLGFCSIVHSDNPMTNCVASFDSSESIVIDPIPDDDNVMRGRDIGMWITSKSFTGLMESLILPQQSNGNRKGVKNSTDCTAGRAKEPEEDLLSPRR
jgi:sugar-specific transcriptional regulator TrmB